MYKVTECKNIIYNVFSEPKYKELRITKRAYIKLMCYINLVGDYEISGFGRIQNGTIIDFKIPKQEVRAAYAECDADSILEFIRSLPREELSEWTLDWHSHVEMSPSPSGTDWNNYESMLNLRLGEQFPVMIVNKYQNYTLMNYISRFNTPDIDLIINDETITKAEIDKIYTEVKSDIETYCTKYIAPHTTTVYQPYRKMTDYYGVNKKSNNSIPSNDCSVVEDDYLPTDSVVLYCASCGTELLTEHEYAIGLCEDCEYAIAEMKGNK